MTQAASRPRTRTKRRRTHAGWVPDQHGAWFMVTVPPLVGVLLGPPALVHVPLLATWWAGYFAFFALGLWVRSRFKDSFKTPLLVYGAVTAVAGLLTLALQFSLAWWALAFSPLIAAALYELWHRRPRSLLSGWSTVLAACLMLPVCAHAGGHPLSAQLWVITGFITLYFLGTVPVVKTHIRKRGDRGWLIFSVSFHVLIAILAVIAAATGWVHWAVVAVSLGLVARAYGMPAYCAATNTRLTPRTVGLVEVVATIAIVVSVLLPV